jgi:serine phosphatase RsbU (regulator of sigma subunit)
MKKTICFLILILAFTVNIFAQDKELDSLWKVYTNESQIDTNRLNALQAYLKKLNTLNLDSSVTIFDSELEKSSLLKKVKSKKWLSKMYSRFGDAFEKKDNFAKALEYNFISLKIKQDIGDKYGIGIIYNNIGNIYTSLANYPKALEFKLKSLKVSEEIGDKVGIGACYINLGNFYFDQSDFQESLNYYFKSLKIKKEIKDTSGMGMCFENIGNIYDEFGDYRKALEYKFKSLEICKKTNDIEGQGISYSNIGVIYAHQHDYSKALEYYLKSLKIKETIDDKYGLVSSNINIGVLYNDTKKHDLALKHGYLALKLAASIGDVDGELLSYQILSNAYAKTGKYKEAYENHVNYKQLTDSIFNADNSKQIGDLKTNFEVEKKETELKAKAEAQALINYNEKQKQRMVLFLVCIVLLLVIIFSALLYKRFRLTNKQKQIIELKEKETELQKNIIEEKHKEIQDSINYAKRIQYSLLASNELLNENLKEHFIFFKPKDVVSGDFYWGSKLSNGNFILVTADSTGHGVPGAIMSILNISCLNEAVTAEKLTQPSDILNLTRKKIIEHLLNDGSEEGGKDGMDCSLLCFDFKNMKLKIAAAQNPVWVIRGKEIIDIKPDKMPVGKHDKQNIPFTQHEFEIQKGDIVYTLTDGYIDQFGGKKGKKFMSKNLKDLLTNNAHLPIHEQKAILESTFEKWKGNIEQVDDVTIIGIKI